MRGQRTEDLADEALRIAFAAASGCDRPATCSCGAYSNAREKMIQHVDFILAEGALSGALLADVTNRLGDEQRQRQAAEKRIVELEAERDDAYKARDSVKEDARSLSRQLNEALERAHEARAVKVDSAAPCWPCQPPCAMAGTAVRPEVHARVLSFRVRVADRPAAVR